MRLPTASERCSCSPIGERFAVAQSRLSSGYLDGGRGLLIAHATNPFAVLVLTVRAAVFGFSHRRSGGPAWVVFLPLGLLVAVVVQMALGFAGLRSVHVFWGVLYLCGVTAYCSYTFRELPSTPARSADVSAARR